MAQPPSLLQRFYNLPISSKQVIALIACELFSLVGLAVGASWIITTNSRSQLLNQAKSEVAVTESNYNVKVNQMGFGFRGQSDNAAIIEATIARGSNKPLRSDLQKQVRQILQNETKARGIEYATLVGKDLRIIANANNNREGEVFNPNNLVSEVLNNSRQIKASAIVSWSELAKESPPLPAGFDRQDALIRYTITPVKDPNTRTTIGALISGDIVNGKLPIVQNTLEAFGSGYSAVYLRKPTGEFALATGADRANVNVALPDRSLLEVAAAAKGQLVTGRMVIGNQTYTMAAKSLPDKIVESDNGAVPEYTDRPSTVLVRGTSETAVNALLTKSLLEEIIVFFLALFVIGLWALLLRRAIIKPIEQLGQTTQKFAEGDRSARAEVFSQDEVGQLAVTFNKMADSIVTSEATLAKQAHRQEAIALEQASLLNELQQAQGVLRLRDRAIAAASNGIVITDPNQPDNPIVFCNPAFENITGYSSAEVLGRNWQLLQGANTDSATVERINNALSEGLPSQVAIENYRKDGTPFWSELTFSPVRDASGQLINFIGVQTDITERKQAEEQLRSSEEAQRQQKEALQHQLVKLLSDVEEVVKGNLTVRAEVTAGEIGTVADFFNAIIESLRQIVTSVKTAAAQVNTSVGQNEGAILQLADEALHQAEEIARMLDSVDQMILSIQAVAESAARAAIVSHTASTTAETGRAAMDVTVQSILNLQQTVAETAAKVKRLGESSQQISKVVSLIEQIALQTNVLSVNASIEAARAGEEGRGFAVVAAEVGQLATQSAAATKEVEQILGNIKLEANEVVRAMELGTTQVVEGTHLVKDARASLGEILDVSRQIDRLVQSISQATVSQTHTAQSVASLMKEIALVSERTSSSSHQVSSSLQQTVEVARQLQVSVGVFQIDSES